MEIPNGHGRPLSFIVGFLTTLILAMLGVTGTAIVKTTSTAERVNALERARDDDVRQLQRIENKVDRLLIHWK